MSRQKGTLVMSANFEIKAAAPLDARYYVPSKADLTQASSWVADGLAYVYKGMQVFVLDSEKLYMLMDQDYTNIDNWQELTGTPTSCLVYKGDVATYSDLPSSGQTECDVYYVVDDVVNYYWNGTKWVTLGSQDGSSHVYETTTTIRPIGANTDILLADIKRIDDNTKTLDLAHIRYGKTLISDKAGMVGVVIGIKTTTTIDDTVIVKPITDMDYYTKSTTDTKLANKVDKVAGKGLSTEDFTTAEKTKLAGLTNYDDTAITTALNNKVDKVAGKGLSTEDYTTAEKTKLSGIETGAEKNKIQAVKVNGTALTPDSNREIDITIGDYTLVKNDPKPGYANTYNLKKDGVTVGDTIEVPENSIIKSGSIETVTTQDVPYTGARVGEKYIDLELDTTPATHIYVPLKDLIIKYTAGDGIDISAANEVRVKIDPTLANGLQSTAAGVGLNLATIGSNGAMSKQDKYKLDNLSNYDDTAIQNALNNKVDKVSGKQLSTEDYTTPEKQKLAGISLNAQENVIETIKVNNVAVGPVNKTVSLTIPTKTSDLINDANFIADANYVHTDNNFTDAEKNKLAGLSNYNDSALRALINAKQDELVSGTNIKTINNQSILGSGNLDINPQCKLGSTLTTNITVGWVDSGTTFPAGTTLESIITAILYKPGAPTPVVNHTVTFYTDGGSSVPPEVIADGSTVSRPATNPTKSGYTFDNWYTNSSYTTAFDFSTPIKSDTIIYAKFDAIPVPTHIVTFNTHGGSAVSSQTVSEGSRATRPTDPTKSGYTFDDWYTASDYTTRFNFSTAIMNNTEIHAKWDAIAVYHTVTYYGLNGTTISTDSVLDNTRATQPANPSETGYTFDGWYTDNTYSTAFNFNTTYILADTAVYAKFDPISSTGYDVYICGFANAECSTAAIFANKTAQELFANKIDQHMVSETQPFTITTTFGDSTKNSIYYLLVKDGVTVTSAEMTSGGITSVFPESEIFDPTIWRAPHSDITLDGTTYHVTGYRTKFNNSDEMAIYVNSSTPTTMYTVSFDTDGGSTIADQIIPDGGYATRPASDPTKTNYTFDDWYEDNTFTTLFNFATTAITTNTIIYAKWVPVPTTYTVTFNTHGGSGVANQTVNENTTATRPNPDPTRTNYVFDNWYTDSTYTTVFDFANTLITANTEIHAKWSPAVVNYTVTFDTDGGSSVPSQTVQSGQTATKPSPDPTKSGYTFDDWYTSNTYVTKYDFSSPINANTTIYAKFDLIPIVTHTVTFDTQGGSYVAPETVNDGGNATRPATNPTKSGYTFDNWYTDTTYTTVFDFTNTSITADTIIYANWNLIPVTTYTVSFNTHGGSTIASQTVNAGSTATKPTDPTKTNYTFDNWYTDSTYSTLFNFSTAINSNTELHANWIPDTVTHTVTFYDGSTVLNTQTIADGSTATRPSPDPTKGGYVFDNWYTDTTYTTLFNFSTAITADTPVYAKFDVAPVVTHTVTFYDGSTVLDTITVNDGSTVTKPNPDPTKTGHTFDNWYTSSDLITTFNFSTAITADTNIYAKFTIETHSVVFYDGATTLDTQTVNYGSTATRPTNPTKSGYTFDNWYADSSFTTAFNFSTTITADTSVYAKFIPITHTVTFYDGSTVLDTQTVNEGSTATRPTNPTKSGYTFDNWYTDTTYTTLFNFSTAITANTDIYAKFDLIPVTHTVTFYDMSGGTISTQTVNDGSTATRPSDPTPPTGMTFDDWYTSNSYTTKFNFSTAITADTGIYAKFDSAPTSVPDIFIGGVYNITAANFGALSDSDLTGTYAIENHLKTETQPFTITTTFGDSTKNCVYYIAVKSGVEPVQCVMTSGGIASTFPASEIKDSTIWRADTHPDITYNGATYKVYGYRTKFNNDDTMAITII